MWRVLTLRCDDCTEFLFLRMDFQPKYFKIVLFDELSTSIKDPSQRDNFCKAIINQLVNFSFEKIFNQKFDFFSTIFEYLIKDYNKDGGGKYAEYYTPKKK